MVGYAILLISFPSIMTHWQTPSALISSPIDWLDQLRIIFNNNLLTKETLIASSVSFVNKLLLKIILN